MPDGSQEQESNLKELLGFDPNDSSSNDESDAMPKPKNERFGWTENWKELFKHAADWSTTKESLYMDEDNLLAVEKFAQGQLRAYYRYISRKSEYADFAHKFDKYTQVYFHTENQYGKTTSMFTEAEPGEVVGISFHTRDGEVQEVKFEGTRASREIEATYLSTGGLNEVMFIMTDYNNIIIDELDGIPDPPERQYTGIYFDSRSKRWEVHGDNPFGFKTFVNNGFLHIKRNELGKEVDVIKAPLVLPDPPQHIYEDLLPDELIRHPDSKNAELDQHWKGKDFFEIVGIEWTVVDNDSTNSVPMGPLEPAPDEGDKRVHEKSKL